MCIRDSKCLYVRATHWRENTFNRKIEPWHDCDSRLWFTIVNKADRKVNNVHGKTCLWECVTLVNGLNEWAQKQVFPCKSWEGAREWVRGEPFCMHTVLLRHTAMHTALHTAFFLEFEPENGKSASVGLAQMVSWIKDIFTKFLYL